MNRMPIDRREKVYYMNKVVKHVISLVSLQNY